MSLTISEIGVRLTVSAPGGPATPKAADGKGEGRPAAALSPQQFDDLVRACVQRVLDTLRMAEGR